jgi:LysR family transcriptional regulator, nitrogen assimilation regulatory protein
MDLRQLQYLVRIVESGSFSRAAHALNIAQPSLSQRIKDLEGELGVELLHRSSSGVRPTEAGLIVMDRAKSILKQVEHLRLEVTGAANTPQGPVAVGLPTSMAIHLTVPLVQAVMDQFPGVQLHVTEGMSGHIQEWVLTGRIDVAILYSFDDVPGLQQTELLTEDLYLIGAADGQADQTTPLRLADVARLPLVLPGRDHGLRRNIERIAGQAGIVLNVPVEVDSLVHTKRLVLDGSLCTILPPAACRDDIRDGRMSARPIVSPPLRRPVKIAVGQDRPLSLAGRQVAKLLASLVATALGEPGSDAP